MATLLAAAGGVQKCYKQTDKQIKGRAIEKSSTEPTLTLCKSRREITLGGSTAIIVVKYNT